MLLSRWCMVGVLGLVMVVMVGCKQEESDPGPKGQGPGGPPGPGGPGGPGGPPDGFPPMPKPPFVEETEPHAAGKKVYNSNGCFQCHTMGGGQAGFPMPPMPMGGPPVPPMPKPKGPDLAKVANKPERNVDWFIAFVNNPMKDNPEAKMPPFEGKITAADMRLLAEFLASLKEAKPQ